MMNHKTMMLVVASAVTLMSASARAQTDDRAAQNREAVRQMFPIVRAFDKKVTPTEPGAAARPTVVAATSGVDVAAISPMSAGPAEVGVTVAAPALIKGAVETFDVGGFRLGMTEEQVLAVAKERGYVAHGSDRTGDYETQVRGILLLKPGGAHLPPTGKTVLNNVTFNAPDNGRYMVQLMVWPDGAHLSRVTYLPPAGMPAATWRELFLAKYGPADATDALNNFSATWCVGHRAGCQRSPAPTQLDALAGPNGGTIVLTTSNATQAKLSNLMDQEVQRRLPHVKPTL